MSNIPPITCLRCFESVARLGSVTAAAKELHVTHSAISQQIKVLEEMIGVTLFVREGRGLRVSEDGRLYALQIRECLGGIADPSTPDGLKMAHDAEIAKHRKSTTTTA